MTGQTRVRGIGAVVLLVCAGSARASFPIGQTIAAGGRDQIFRMTDTGGGSGTANLYGVHLNGANVGASTEIQLCFVTANHVAAAGVGSIDYRGVGMAGTFNAVPLTQTVQRLGGEDVAFVGLKFTKAALGVANFTTLAGIVPLTLAADAGGNHTFQEWGYGISATPDAANYPAFAFVFHAANAGEQYGTARTFRNTYTGNAVRNTTGYSVRDVQWVVGGAAQAMLGSGCPGDSGAGLSDLAGAATTIQGILTGGTDTRFLNGDIAWRNTDNGFGLGFTAQVVTDLNNKCDTYAPAPGALGLGLAGLTVLAVRRRRS